MEMWKLAGVAVAAAALCLTVRRQQPDLSALCGAAAGALMLLSALEGIGEARALYARVSALSGLREGYLALLMKVLGVAYVTELAAQTCAELGEGGLATKVGLCGKLAIFTLAAPMLMSLLETILELAP